MSEYPCSVCGEWVHSSELETRKINGIEQLVCTSCIEYNEVDKHLEAEVDL
jgi:formylmethanofuran dehydrogenase subunit E